MTVHDGRDVDRLLGQRVGPSVAAILGIGVAGRPSSQEAKARNDALRIVRHRVLALLASLKMVEFADRADLPSVLILEGDVRPVTRHALTRREVEELSAFLASHPWQVVRPSGYFWDFAPNRGKGAVRQCPAQCKCAGGVGLSRACLVKRTAAHGMHHVRSPPCDVRDTVGFAVHRRTFPAFRKLRRVALDALAEMAARVEAKVVASGGNPATASDPNDFQRRVDQQLNDSFGATRERFNAAIPWFDKWLPARFDNLYVLPSIAVQQVRQGDERTSSTFRAACAANER